MEKTPTPTKPRQPQAFESAREAPKEQEELACEPKSQLGPNLTSEERESPQPSSKNLDNMAATTRPIMTENPDIAQRIMEHLKTQPGRPLRPEEFQTVTKSVEDQLRAEGV